MISKLLTTSVQAPGFFGLNTQDSSVTLESGFATVARNCVIDKFGRIGARKGWTPKNMASEAVGSNSFTALGELIDLAGVSYILGATQDKLFRLNGTSLVELTYGGPGVAPVFTGGNWQMASLDGTMYMYQEGNTPLYYDPSVSLTTYRRISEAPSYLGTVQPADCAISAYGRIWSARTTTNKSLIQFSDLLDGTNLATGTSGTLDVSQVWPNGTDEITALAAHNGFLIVFGRRQILIYANPQEPAALQLQDAITGVGCLARDSVALTGGDVLFLSDSGVRSLQRVIQEKSAPLRDISANVRDDLVEAVEAEGVLKNIKGVYSDQDAFYLLSFPDVGVVYCFDTRSQLQNGANRATTWDSLLPKAMLYTRDKELLFGLPSYIGKYNEYADNGVSYMLAYYTTYFDFGSPTALKLLKKIGVNLIGGSGYSIAVRTGFDYSENYRLNQLMIPMSSRSEYGIAEYGIAEYGPPEVGFGNQLVNSGGSGRVIQLGFEADILNEPLSVQKIDVYVKAGKTK
jgi:hypothetical protein